MTAAEVVHMELKRQHAALDESLKDLTPEQRHLIVHPSELDRVVVWHSCAPRRNRALLLQTCDAVWTRALRQARVPPITRAPHAAA